MFFKAFFDFSERVSFLPHFQKDIGPVKTRNKYLRFIHVKVRGNILADMSSCSCREGKAHRTLKLPADGRNLHVIRTKVMPPLAYAVRFVNRNAADRNAAIVENILRPLSGKRFGRKVEQFYIACFYPSDGSDIVFPFKRAVQKKRIYAVFQKRRHLILHERNKRRNDNRNP